MLKKVPHFTTLQKFLQRIGEGVFKEVVQKIYGRLKIEETMVGVDATGIEIVHASAHYLKRIEREKCNPRLKKYHFPRFRPALFSFPTFY